MSVDLPNLLTVLRIGAIVPVAALLLARSPAGDLAACLLFVLASATDWLDGWLARRAGPKRDPGARAIGRMLDPIADKLLVASALLLLAASGRLGDLGLVPALVISAREVLVAGLREHVAGLGSGPALPVTVLAKWKTAAQMTALSLLLLGDGGASLVGLGAAPVEAAGLLLLWVAAGLTLVTGWSYLVGATRQLAAHERARGLHEG